MQTVLHRAETRGHANHGWLDSHHTFSFADYITPNACTSAYSACSMTTWWLLPVASAAFAAGRKCSPQIRGLQVQNLRYFHRVLDRSKLNKIRRWHTV